MKKDEFLLKKYELLSREWSSISTTLNICFAAGVVGFVIGLAMFDLIIVLAMFAFMGLFAVYDLKIRMNYIESKHKLEKVIEKTLGVKHVPIKEIAERTIFD